MSGISVATYHSPTCNEHIEKEQADDAECAYCEIEDLQAERDRLREALEEINIGDGPYSMDPLKHAGNCISNMMELASHALNPETAND